MRNFRSTSPKATEAPAAPKQALAPEATVQKASETPVQAKTPEVVTKNTETVITQAASPASARHAVESVTNSTRKMSESFSAEWLEKIAHKLGKPVKWIADQSV